MQKLIDLLSHAWANKHTTTSALVLFGAKVFSILWPQYKDLINDLTYAAITYGLLMAGDSKAQTPTQPTK